MTTAVDVIKFEVKSHNKPDEVRTPDRHGLKLFDLMVSP